ncbi:DUF2818 family protein [Pseudacidovorax intermedius]|uniref:Uncharacterized protein DUF2818 n=1 Tax=Pseudacidovorax intermedius TaxID=433924 RepID=A0A370FE86_9BURK|nr:DUF2818 family protein [Pseudacidovorax intermedius]RDI22122.1 uncharacterized protein DUF2818 [Pseudacidovorax intermedius]
MGSNASAWVVLGVALVLANLPFLNERLFAVLPWRTEVKPLAVRLGELVLCYLLAGMVGRLFEGKQGMVAAQGWEFYAVTAAFFLVLAFPGFIWRYLLKRKGH